MGDILSIGLESRQFKIWLERNDKGDWIRNEQEVLLGSTVHSYRDGRNRRCELNIISDPLHGAIPDTEYEQLLRLIYDALPEGAYLKSLLGDESTLRELTANLPETYRDLGDIYPFSATPEEVVAAMQSPAPLSEDDRITLENNLAEACLRSFKTGKSPIQRYWPKYLEAMSKPPFAGTREKNLFTEMGTDLFPLMEIQILLPTTSWARVAYETGFTDFRFRLAESTRGETDGKPVPWNERGRREYHKACIECRKVTKYNVIRVAVLTSRGEEGDIAELPEPVDVTYSPSRSLLNYLHTNRSSSEYERAAHGFGSQKTAEALARFEGRDPHVQEPHLFYPEEALRILSPSGTKRKVGVDAVKRISDEIAKRSGFPLARSKYSEDHQELMRRIDPNDAELAIVFVHVKGSHDLDKKRDTVSILAALERLHELGYYTLTCSSLSLDPIDSYGFQEYQREEIGHLLDVVHGRGRLEDTGRVAIVGAFDYPSTIDYRIEDALPTLEELEKFGVKSVCINIEGLYDEKSAFRYAKECQLTVADLMQERFLKSNKPGLDGIRAHTADVWPYVKALRDGGIKVTLRGIGDSKAEREFMKLTRFSEIIDAAKVRPYGRLLKNRIIQACASHMDGRAYPQIAMVGPSGVASMPITDPNFHYLNAGRLEALYDRATHDNDRFTLSVLRAMTIKPEFLREMAKQMDGKDEFL